MVAQLNPAQARFFFWFNGLAQIGTSIASPLVTRWQLQRSGLPPAERQSLVVQDVVRQGINTLVLVVTYFGGAWLTGKVLRPKPQNKTFAQLVGGVLMSFVGYGLVKPLISSDLVVRWLQHEQGRQTPAASPRIMNTMPAYIPAHLQSGNRSGQLARQIQSVHRGTDLQVFRGAYQPFLSRSRTLPLTPSL